MSRHANHAALPWFLAVLLCCAPPLLADGPQTGTIDGRVTNTEGNALPGVSITLTGPQRTRSAITDADGGYRFALLQAGDFTITAELEGLGRAEFATTLNPGQRRGVNLTLIPAEAEEITVTADAVLISKYDTGVISTAPAEVVENVAYATRNYASTLRQLPGVVSVAESDNLPAVNGGISTETQVLIDGVDTSNTRRGGEARLIMPATALAESRLETQGFGAEYGRVMGGVINSTVKTGTNELHGNFLYVGQNPKWRALNQLELERPDDHTPSFEASLGGPLRREKAWFFVSWADMTNNLLDRLRDGTVIDSSRTSEPRIAKLNFQPSDRHQLAGTWIDSRGNGIASPGNSGDFLSLMDRPLFAQLTTVTWSVAASNSVFLEMKASARKDLFPRNLLFPKETLDANASPDDPPGNNYRYRDLLTNLRHNGPASGSGIGYNDFPRDTASASVSIFRNNHELKFGIDVQDIAFTNLGNVGKEFRGRGYDPTLPGGYERPQRVRVFEDSVPSHSEGIEAALYAQDRIDIGDRWSLHVGLRLDDQTIENDVGREVDDSQEVAPRLTAVYDINADGSLLFRASVGRYYQNIPLDFAYREYSELPTGQQSYTEYNWNPATLRYDRFRRQVRPAGGGKIQRVDHFYKDQVAVGLDWQFSRNWVFRASAVSHETDNIYFGNEQFTADGTGVERVVRNWAGAYREYQGATFELNRRFRDNWSLNTNLTIGDAKGNTASVNTNSNLFEGLGGVELDTGATDATSRYQAGRLGHDIDRLNIVAVRIFELGAHRLSLGGFFSGSSGRYFGPTLATTVAHPTTGAEIDTVTRLAPRDDLQLDDIYTLSASLVWFFPIRGSLEGQLGFEAANLTDQQGVLFVNPRTLEPISTVTAWQLPREFRLKAGFRF